MRKTATTVLGGVILTLGGLAGTSLLLTSLYLATPIMADDARFWVVGSMTKGCRIVEQNPVIDGIELQFSDGPYKSRDDAELAMSTISVCKT